MVLKMTKRVKNKVKDTLDQFLFSQIESNKKENIKLSTLRDTLLPKLMSGELSVEEVSLD